MTLSKSDYIKGLQCQKALWFSKNLQDLNLPPDDEAKAKFAIGDEVTNLARKCFVDGVTANNETIGIFIPMEIKKRGGTAMIILPKNVNPEEGQKCFDDTMIKSIARAYKWKIMIDKEEVDSLADIARRENLSTGFVSKIFNLNFLAPKVVERILSGTQPRSLKLQDIVTNEIPDLWQEQLENWGFEKS